MGSASKQYAVNSLPVVSGDITHHTITNPAGIGTGTLHYYSVGKLYFGWWFAGSGGTQLFPGSSAGGGQGNASAAQLAVIAGLPVPTVVYLGQNYGAYTLYWTGTGWNSTPPTNNTRDIVLGFLTS